MAQILKGNATFLKLPRRGPRPFFSVGVIFTARSSYASAVLGIVILSVCLSVTRVLWRNERTYSWNFGITWKSDQSSFLIPKEVGGRCPLPPVICAWSVLPPLKYALPKYYRKPQIFGSFPSPRPRPCPGKPGCMVTLNNNQSFVSSVQRKKAWKLHPSKF